MTDAPGPCPNCKDAQNVDYTEVESGMAVECGLCWASTGLMQTREAALAAWERMRQPVWRTDVENAPYNVKVDLLVRGPLMVRNPRPDAVLGRVWREPDCIKRTDDGEWIDSIGRYVEFSTFRDADGDECIMLDDKSEYSSRVTHWMLPPEPPKEGK